MEAGFTRTDLERIGAKLRWQRITNDEKMEVVAKATGISKKVISQVENGRYYSLKVATLLKLAQHFKISPGELFAIGNPEC